MDLIDKLKQTEGGGRRLKAVQGMLDRRFNSYCRSAVDRAAATASRMIRGAKCWHCDHVLFEMAARDVEEGVFAVGHLVVDVKKKSGRIGRVMVPNRYLHRFRYRRIYVTYEVDLSGVPTFLVYEFRKSKPGQKWVKLQSVKDARDAQTSLLKG